MSPPCVATVSGPYAPDVSERLPLLDRVGVLRPLRIRDFALLWTGLTISMVGDGIYIVAIAWQAYELWNTPAALAFVGIAWSLPQIVFTLASGVLSDRLDRRALMIAGDLIRLVAIGAVGALSITGRLTIPLLVGLVAFYGIGQAAFLPAFTAIVPTIVTGELLVEANSLGQFVRPFAETLVGPLVGGVLVATTGAGWAFVLDAATFGFSAAMILSMRTRHNPRADETHTSVWQDAVEGMKYVRSTPWLMIGLLAGLVSLLVVWGPWETLVPYVVKNDLHGSALDLGLVFGAGGVGSVGAAVVLGQRARLPKRALTVLYLAWAVGMLGTAGFGIVTHVWQAMAVALVTEGSITILIVIWYTLLQRLVPDRLLGRVSSLDWMVSTAGLPLSFGIVGPAASAFGTDATLIVAGLLGCAVTLGFMLIPGAVQPERDGSLAE
jgi:transmembrane secretion effector